MIETVSLRMVLTSVAFVFDTGVVHLRSHRRTADVIPARLAACLIARDLTEFSLPKIGRAFGNRDHSTIWYAIREAEARCEADPEYASKVAVAKAATLALSRSMVAHRLQDVDATAVAERVCADLVRAPSMVSTDDIVAMAVRLLELEDVAGIASQLVGKLAPFLALPEPFSRAEQAHREKLGEPVTAFADTLSSALTALGYSPKEEEHHDSHTTNA